MLLEFLKVTATAKSLQLCPTLCDLIDGSLPGSPVPGILQARTLEWVSIGSLINLFFLPGLNPHIVGTTISPGS